MKTSQLIGYFTRNIFTVIGLVLIWRGVWYLLDEIDLVFFGKSHVITTIGGIILGLLILYIPDKDLKEISKLI
jgi:hypothetical protein